MVRRIVVLVIVAGLIAGGIYYYTHQARGQITLTGIVTTDNVIVSSQIAGKLQELKVKEGEKVIKGQLLAVIQPAQWRADLTSAQATASGAATQVSIGEADLKLQEDQTNAQIAQAQAAAAVAMAQVTQVEADVEAARLSFVHTQDAYRRGAEAQDAYDQARLTYDAQQARLEATKKQRDQAEAAVDVAKANLHQITARRAMVALDEHQLAAAEAETDKAQVLLGYSEIVAPVDGIVDVRAARAGEVVNPGQPIVTLINPDDLWVRIDVEESYIDQIRNGEKLPVRFSSGAVLEGTVFFRGVDADYATQRDVSRTKRDIKTFEIRLRCDNSHRTMAVGMTAYVTLPGDMGSVPAAASGAAADATAPATSAASAPATQ